MEPSFLPSLFGSSNTELSLYNCFYALVHITQKGLCVSSSSCYSCNPTLAIWWIKRVCMEGVVVVRSTCTSFALFPFFQTSVDMQLPSFTLLLFYIEKEDKPFMGSDMFFSCQNSRVGL